jgi:hypothetical protein
MSNRISDCPPLLQPGEHQMTIEDLREMCVAKFQLSTTRRWIFDGFLKIVEMLRAQQIPCELVVDGSYLTEEINPDDIDFAVVVSPEVYEGSTGEARKLLDWIGDDKTIQSTHQCDPYLCVEYKQGHRIWFEGIYDRAWWVEFYSKSKFYKRERGVAIVSLNATRIAA